MRRRWAAIVVIVFFAGLWSLALGVLGLWLILDPHEGLLSSAWIARSAGLLCLSASQIVFLWIAADRVFPGVSDRIRALAHSGNLLILTASLGVLITASIITSV